MTSNDYSLFSVKVTTTWIPRLMIFFRVLSKLNAPLKNIVVLSVEIYKNGIIQNELF